MAESSASAAQNDSQEEASTPQGKSCAHCNKQEESPDPEANPGLKPCIMCKSVLYCSRDCKKADTKKHKKVCASLAQEYARTHEVKMASRAPPKADTHRGGLQKWQFDT
ncbi:HIT MYND zinc finger [Lecanosticta acicola]|uniref:HIT MYND zinc finger n=1 Tax=Lecanosticta acicola TaxID=111012 RepID=A0AAI9EG51_9PEZI|nr:HIT MYND zinc finger [Lecanosticta acicola]